MSAGDVTDAVAGIGLGANLGDVAATLDAAVDELSRLPRSRLVARSATYRSAPLDAPGPEFLNAAVLLRTALDSHALLAELQRIERRHGRERKYRNAPRTLDLDLLFFGVERFATPALTLPHPRLHERAFVLLPLRDIAPELTLPGLGRVADFLPIVEGQGIVRLPA